MCISEIFSFPGIAVLVDLSRRGPTALTFAKWAFNNVT